MANKLPIGTQLFLASNGRVSLYLTVARYFEREGKEYAALYIVNGAWYTSALVSELPRLFRSTAFSFFDIFRSESDAVAGRLYSSAASIQARLENLGRIMSNHEEHAYDEAIARAEQALKKGKLRLIAEYLWRELRSVRILIKITRGEKPTKKDEYDDDIPF